MLSKLKLLKTQRDLMTALSVETDLQQCLRICLQVSLDSTGFDCGGVYLFDECEGVLKLFAQNGLCSSFVKRVEKAFREHNFVRLIKSKKPLYGNFEKVESVIGSEANAFGLKYFGIIPLLNNSEVIGCFSLGSYEDICISQSEMLALESIASMIGGAVVRIRTAERLSKNQTLLEEKSKIVNAIFEAELDLIVVLSNEFIVLDCNRSFERHLSANRVEIIGRDIRLLLKNMPAERARKFAKCVETEEPVRFEDSREGRFFEITFYPLLKDSGKIEQVLAIFRDVTSIMQLMNKIERQNDELDRKVLLRTLEIQKVNRQLLEEVEFRKSVEQDLRVKEQAIENSINAMGLASIDDKIIYVNKSLLHMWGYDSARELHGCSTIILFKDAQRVKEILKEISETGSWFGEILAEGKDGRHFWVQVTSTLIYNHERDPLFMFGSFVNIDEKKKYEKIVQETEKQRALGEMSGRIAHEINNPLADIKNSFHLIKRTVPEDFQYYDYIGRIEKEIERISRIVHNMLEIYRPSSEGYQLVDLKSLIDDVILFLNPGCDVSVSNLCFVPNKVILSEDALRQILFNLIKNALEASGQKGNVTVKSRVNESELVIDVEDSGKGVEPSDVNHVFDPFYSTKRCSSKAVGIGLSITKCIVDKMGGRISFESELDKGTIFTVKVPIRSNL